MSALRRPLQSLAALALLWPGLTQAQSIDYGALEALFNEPVTTSVTGSPQRSSDAPAAIEIISADDIRRSGATNLPDLLSHLASIDVLRWGSASADLSVRGYNQPNNSRLLVLVNGRQVYIDDFGRTDWASIPVQFAEIRQIEVIKGPNSALFGFNAAGGVINIITFDPLNDDIKAASVTIGTQDMRQISAVATAHLGETTGVRLSIGGTEQHEFATLIPANFNLGIFGQLEPRRPTSRSVSLASTTRITNGITLGLEATHSTSQHLEAYQSNDYDDVRKVTSSLKGTLSADSPIGLVSVSSYGNFLDDSSRYIFASTYHNVVSVNRLEDLYKVNEDNAIKGSLEYRFNTIGVGPNGAGNVFYSVYAPALMWEHRLAPDLTLTNAVRLDNLVLGRDGPTLNGFPSNHAYDRTIRELSFNSGLVWKPDERNSFRLTAARGAQLPGLNALALQGYNSGVFGYSGNPGLDPTTVTNFEAGWDRDLPEIGGQGRLSAFYQLNDRLQGDVFESLFLGVIPASGPTYLFANIGRSREFGLEASLNVKLSRHWEWEGDYRLSVIHDDLNGLSAYSLWRPARETPRNELLSHIRFTQDAVELDLFAGLRSHADILTPSFGALIPTRIPAHGTLGGRLAYRLNDAVDLALSGDDLTAGDGAQGGQIQTVGRAVERRFYLTLSSHF